MQKNYMMNANDVADELGVSKGHAYKVIRKLNAELKTKSKEYTMDVKFYVERVKRKPSQLR